MKSIFPILFFICTTLLFSACVNDLKKIDEIASQKNIGEEIGKNVEVHVSNDGIMRMKITATETIHHSEGKNYTEFPKGIKAYSYNPAGDIESSLTARYALLNEVSGEIEGMLAKNDVVVVNAKGEKLNTEELLWSQKKKLISTPGFVKITTSEQIIYGRGLDAKEDFSSYTIRQVTGKVKINTSDLP